MLQSVTSEPSKGFTYLNDRGEKAVCQVSHWPIKNPVAILKCDNGWEPEMELITDGAIRFNGVEMYVTDKNGVCD